MTGHLHLPIDTLQDRFLSALARGPVVVTAPTGSGKSTQIPRWCPPPVVVVEPRRVACRGLAQRVSELCGTELGTQVGYQVREERRATEDTQILFVTPGIALQQFATLERYRTVIIDEFHERRLDTDLLLALWRGANRSLVVMSATLDGPRVAHYLGGEHLAGEGRQFPVCVQHLPGAPDIPDPRDLGSRVALAVRAAQDDPGDILVFLPGKGEIAAAATSLQHESELQVVELHGGLTLVEQSRAFAAAQRRKVILATNVAETSVTVPGVGVVIDSGLVRRTRYHQGRGHLTLVPIALDSAAQRAGRAGRTRPGVCYRMWSARARLERHTPPEVHRESLVPLVLAAAACGTSTEALELLDPPKPHAIEQATTELNLLGVLDESGRLTKRGRQLFGLPIDAWLGRLLVEAQESHLLADCIDLVATLAVGRPLFTHRPHDEEADLRRSGCDLTARVRAVRIGHARRHGLDAAALVESRETARRLRIAMSSRSAGDAWPDRDALVEIAIRADPRCVYVPRTRRGRTTWANGGTEIELARESAVHSARQVEAIVVLDTRAIGTGARSGRVIATCASPVKLGTLARLGVGRDRVARALIEGDHVVARIERVFAKKTLAAREEVPQGALARDAILDLFLDGRLFPEALATSRTRVAQAQLASQLAASGFLDVPLAPDPASTESWARERLLELGVESGHDLALLSPEDLTAPELPDALCQRLEREFPLRLNMGDATYEVDYDLTRRQVLLKQAKGQRRTPPPSSYLPGFGGFRVFAEAGGTMHRIR